MFILFECLVIYINGCKVEIVGNDMIKMWGSLLM